MDQTLFIGFPLTDSYIAELDKLPSSLKEVFISAEYLQKVTKDETSYLGKKIDSPFDLADLESTEMHIISLLKKLVPNYTYSLFLLG